MSFCADGAFSDCLWKQQPNAEVIQDGLSISRNSVPDAEGEVIDWVNGLDLNN